uniref:RNA methyltransferase n=1 Tax=Steinernema glaseri TaxID=37863 RepID=A0A1I8A5W4_9BILA
LPYFATKQFNGLVVNITVAAEVFKRRPLQ